ncbi:hypothetical protein ACHOLT_12350 [Desulfitobacterium sp. Sab5]|uniref:hypothetical protein n=1 Tax=Desulfitobacterium nosdiversum TaxID=3375356 RepID=UPI003CF957C7
MGLTIILISVCLAGIWGFIVPVLVFGTRLNLKTPWRWVIGAICGLLVGMLLAFVEFMIIWPPMNPIVNIIGIVILAVISGLLLIEPQMKSED